MNDGGLAEEKILRVTGLSASIPYNPANPDDPMNRRISIIVMNKKTEQHILQEAGNKSVTAVNDTASPDKPHESPPDKEAAPPPVEH